jgi:hypothetical protein
LKSLFPIPSERIGALIDIIRGIQSRRFGRDSVAVSWRDSDREFGSKFESSGLPDRKVWIWDISFPSDRTNVLSLHSKRKDGFQLDRMNTLDEGLPLDIFPSFRTATFFILSGGLR